MKKLSLLFTMALSGFVLAACSSSAIAGADRPVGDAIKGGDGLSVTKISEHAWVFTSTYVLDGSPVPANGMLVATAEGFVMIDTPWTDDQTEALLDLIGKQFDQKVSLALFTHAHIDRIGGVKALQDRSIRAIGTALTAKEAVKNGFAEPEAGITQDVQTFTVGGVRIEAFYPGGAHSSDNIVVWVPADKVLFGGCMIKAADAENLGSTADADLVNWPSALENVKRRYGDAELVVPGHGAWGGMELLEHTFDLFK